MFIPIIAIIILFVYLSNKEDKIDRLADEVESLKDELQDKNHYRDDYPGY